MRIYLHLFPPFSSAVGKKRMELNIEQNKILFKDLIDLLIDDFPRIQDLFPINITEENFYGNCYAIRDGKLLGLEDYINEGDIVSLYGSLSGG